jgi:hypothetical protein
MRTDEEEGQWWLLVLGALMRPFFRTCDSA